MATTYSAYKDETELPDIVRLIVDDLSEPYSIYVYRYFLHQWPEHAYIARDSKGAVIGVIMCKLEMHRGRMRGYIAMIAVNKACRGRGIAKTLATRAIAGMVEHGAEEIALETEVNNTAARRLYESLGFLRYKRLYRYYLNGADAFRFLKVIYPGSESS